MQRPTHPIQIDSHVGNRLDQSLPIVSERSPQLADALHQRIVRDGEIRPDRGKSSSFETRRPEFSTR